MRDVSILLLTRNGAATLPELLARVRSQEFEGRIELVAVDSGSTDGTLGLLQGHADTIVSIDPAEFNHGETRNVGIAATTAELVVLVVQDAIPADRGWLRELVAPMADEAVAASWARQIPAADASAVTRMHLQRWFGASREPRTVSIDPAAFHHLPSWRQFELCALDNVCACIRRRAWEQHPFRRVPIGEDVEWARDVLLDDWRIVYAPRSVVQHSQKHAVRYELVLTHHIHHRLRTV
jgi:rhamnosyltransferase